MSEPEWELQDDANTSRYFHSLGQYIDFCFKLLSSQSCCSTISLEAHHKKDGHGTTALREVITSPSLLSTLHSHLGHFP